MKHEFEDVNLGGTEDMSGRDEPDKCWNVSYDGKYVRFRDDTYQYMCVDASKLGLLMDLLLTGQYETIRKDF